MMVCIICQDSGSEPLQKNTSCSCKYNIHSSCWIDYVHSRTTVICPLCRKDLTKKTSAKTNSTIPYSSQLRTHSEETGQQITYQEFVEIIHSNQRLHETPPQVSPNSNNTTNNKIFKLILGLGIIAVIIILIVVLV